MLCVLWRILPYWREDHCVFKTSYARAKKQQEHRNKKKVCNITWAFLKVERQHALSKQGLKRRWREMKRWGSPRKDVGHAWWFKKKDMYLWTPMWIKVVESGWELCTFDGMLFVTSLMWTKSGPPKK